MGNVKSTDKLKNIHLIEQYRFQLVQYYTLAIILLTIPAL